MGALGHFNMHLVKSWHFEWASGSLFRDPSGSETRSLIVHQHDAYDAYDAFGQFEIQALCPISRGPRIKFEIKFGDGIWNSWNSVPPIFHTDPWKRHTKTGQPKAQ